MCPLLRQVYQFSNTEFMYNGGVSAMLPITEEWVVDSGITVIINIIDHFNILLKLQREELLVVG